jgi:hypothetical protein
MPHRIKILLCLFLPVASLVAVSCAQDQSRPNRNPDRQPSVEAVITSSPEPDSTEPSADQEAIAPGQYCYGVEDENLTATAIIDLMVDNYVDGTVNATVHNEELGYYTAYTQTLTGSLERDELNLNITTNIELDTQNSQEVWAMSVESLNTERQIFDRIDCAQITQLSNQLDQVEAISAAAKLSADRLGNIEIGMTLSEAETAAKTTLLKAVNDPSQDCYFVLAQALPTEAMFMVVGDRIARIDIPRGSTIKTDRGIGINSTEEAVKLAYPDVEIEPHKYTAETGGKYMTWQPQSQNLANYRIEFETDGVGVTAFRSGRLPEVSYVEGCS